MLPCAAAGENGTASLHLTADRGGSSLLEPDPDKYARYGHEVAARVEEIVPVETRTLEAALDEAGIAQVDAIKLDTQGTELEILRSLGRQRLRSLLFLESEVEFVRLYHDQPLFRDLDAFLSREGFELFFLNRVFWNYGRRGWRSYGRGQLVHGDVHYLRHSFDHLDPASVGKLIVVSCLYGYADYARWVFEHAKGSLEALGSPILGELSAWAAKRWQSPVERLGTTMNLVFDRLLYAWLRVRRWNGLASDSDRNYPIR